MVRGDSSDKGERVGTTNGEQYELTGQLLGIGTFARVLEGRQVTTGQPVALKFLMHSLKQGPGVSDIQTMEESSILDEIDLQQRANNPYCVCVLDVIHDVDFTAEDDVSVYGSIVIVMEKAREESLFEIVRSIPLSETIVRTYFTHLIEGLDHCHKQGICHRDLKPENAVLGWDNLALKICDFGEGKVLDDTKMTHTMERGSGYYRAPEVLSETQTPYNAQISDIWSVGVMLFTMLSGRPPLEEIGDFYYKKLEEHALATFWQAHGHTFFSYQCRDLLNKILEPDPSKRISLAGIKAHPWYNETVLGPSALKQEMTRNLKQMHEQAPGIAGEDQVDSGVRPWEEDEDRDVAILSVVQAQIEDESEDSDSDDDSEQAQALKKALAQRRAAARERLEKMQAEREERARREQPADAPVDLYDGEDDDEDEDEDIERKFSTTPPVYATTGVTANSFLSASTISSLHRSAERACQSMPAMDNTRRSEFEWMVFNREAGFNALLSLFSVEADNGANFLVKLRKLGGSENDYRKFQTHVFRRMRKHVAPQE